MHETTESKRRISSLPGQAWGGFFLTRQDQKDIDMILKEKLTIMKGEEIDRHLKLLAEKIIQHCKCVDNIYLVGIRKGGEELAIRLKKMISDLEGAPPLLGFIDITLYRDDVLTLAKPVIGRTDISEGINNRIVVLVDDVLYTGRTIRAAMDMIIDYGRPQAIRLAVLVDRGLRELPIQPDFAARVIPTSADERVEVIAGHPGEDDRVVIYAIEAESAAPQKTKKTATPKPKKDAAPKSEKKAPQKPQKNKKG